MDVVDDIFQLLHSLVRKMKIIWTKADVRDFIDTITVVCDYMTKAHRTLVAVFFMMLRMRVLTCFKSSRDWKSGKKCRGMAFWGIW
jgi:hypothetical protein